MARPRLPASKASLIGADKHNPKRFKGRSEPEKTGREVGGPPAYLGDAAKKAWSVLVTELPWLVYEDRAILEVVSIMRGAVIAGLPPDTPSSFFANYRMALSSLGATPVDRSKVYQPPQDDAEDEFDQFVQ